MNSEINVNQKIAVVTGATSGIGFAAANALAAHGASIIGIGRDSERCRQAAASIQALQPHAVIRFLTADLSLQSQVRKVAEEIRLEIGRLGAPALDILVNNAGTYSWKYQQTGEGIELTLAVNHLAPFLLTHEMLPLLHAASSARVITVSSGSHYRTTLNLERLNRPLIYNGLWAYKVSKLANILFTKELNRRMSGSSIRGFAVDPGLVNTGIGHKGTDWLSSLVWQFRRSAGVQPEVPARTILFLAGNPTVQNSPDIYWYDCQPKIPSGQAQDGETARKLWEISCQMCALEAR